MFARSFSVFPADAGKWQQKKLRERYKMLDHNCDILFWFVCLFNLPLVCIYLLFHIEIFWSLQTNQSHCYKVRI